MAAHSPGLQAAAPPPQNAIAVLLLAHYGAQQTAMWQAWRDNCSTPELLHLYAHIPAAYQHLIAQCMTLIPNPLEETGWGQPSLVLAYQRSVRYILESNPNVTMVYLCSGFDVPAQHADFLFLPRNMQMSRIHQMLHGNAMLNETRKQLFLKNKWISAKNPRNHFIKHQQWIRLTREHCQFVVDFNFETLAPVHQYFRDNHLDYFPDEYYIWYVLSSNKVLQKEVQNMSITSMYFPHNNAASPLTWSNPDWLVPQIVVNQEGVQVSRTLKMCLEEIAANDKEDQQFFFRKVSSTVNSNDLVQFVNSLQPPQQQQQQQE